ncbi:MAG: GNAT family N-acetyltransferase [Lachnospiraceae bacterium]|nr:GNAT family N-acetyltransferase [Lachnospiraceae bacterium]
MIIWQSEDKNTRIDALTRLVPKKKFELMTLGHICREYDNTYSTVELEAGYRPDRHFRSFFLYCEGKRLAGELFIFLPDRSHAEITVIVDPYRRRNGIFTRLVAAAKEELDKYGIKEIYFVAEPDCEAANEVREHLGAECGYSELMMKLSAEKTGDGLVQSGSGQSAGGEEDVGGRPAGGEEGYTVRFDDGEEGFEAILENVPDKKEMGHILVSLFENTAFISHVEIREDLRGRGLGKILVGAAVARIFEKGHDTVRLQVRSDNTAAAALYEKLGFRTVSKLDYITARK